MPGRIVKAIILSSIEFVVLVGLWMLFVSQLQVSEFVAGIGAAALGALGDGIVKSKRFAKFRPRAEWLWLFTWEPWYVLTGSGATFRAIAKRLAGKKSDALFRVVPFRPGGDDPESAARLALAIAAISISPETIVVGVDRERGLMLIHLIAPAATPEIARRLGAQS